MTASITLKQFNDALRDFTNASLCNSHHTDPVLLQEAKKHNQLYIWEFIQNHIEYFDNCFFSGTVYRVLFCRKADVYFDDYITHWTKNIDMFVNNTICVDEIHRYCWLTAKVINGFSVNDYEYEAYNPYISYENEVIFPMSREYVTDVFYGTYSEFKRHLNTQKPAH